VEVINKLNTFLQLDEEEYILLQSIAKKLTKAGLLSIELTKQELVFLNKLKDDLDENKVQTIGQVIN